MSDARRRDLERAVAEDPGDLGALRRWADERRRLGLELLPARRDPLPILAWRHVLEHGATMGAFAEAGRLAAEHLDDLFMAIFTRASVGLPPAAVALDFLRDSYSISREVERARRGRGRRS